MGRVDTMSSGGAVGVGRGRRWPAGGCAIGNVFSSEDVCASPRRHWLPLVWPMCESSRWETRFSCCLSLPNRCGIVGSRSFLFTVDIGNMHEEEPCCRSRKLYIHRDWKRRRDSRDEIVFDFNHNLSYLHPCLKHIGHDAFHLTLIFHLTRCPNATPPCLAVKHDCTQDYTRSSK